MTVAPQRHWLLSASVKDKGLTGKIDWARRQSDKRTRRTTQFGLSESAPRLKEEVPE